MPKIKIHTLILVIVYALIPIIVILMMHNMSMSDILMKMGSNGFGYAQTMIYTEEDRNKYDLIDDVCKEDTSIAVYGDEKRDDNTTLRQIYFNSDYVNIPMESGRFFKRDDFIKGNNVAVVGKNLLEIIYQKDGKNYIQTNDTELAVIGVCGYKEANFYDNFIFVNMLSDMPSEKTDYVIDFLSGIDLNEANAITADHIRSLREKNINVGQRTTVDSNYIENIMPNADTNFWFIILIVASFLCLIVASVQWVNAKKKEICIKRLLGSPIGTVNKELSIRYMLIVGISILTGIVYSRLVYFGNIRFLVFAYLILIAFACFFLLVVRKVAAKHKITEVINQ